MQNFIITTDTGCDIKPAILAEWGVSFRSLTFRFDGEDREYTEHDIAIKDFYDRMRGGAVAKTAAANTEAFREMFEENLKAGNDVLHIGFSSGLSTTYNAARIAAAALQEQYPERTIITVDSLAASAGQGLLVYFAVEKKNAGASIEEVAAFLEDNKLNLCHWFTVDDLVYLKRGGRVSAVSAFVGTMLGIKPVLHVDNEGHLVPVTKVRGRRAALLAIVEQYGKLALDTAGGTVFICHADCENDVKFVADTLKEKYGATVKLITDVGTVIGAHSGPGTFALFFLGQER